jgi:hypothetical protein
MAAIPAIENIYFPVKHGKPTFALKKEDVIHYRFEGTPEYLQGYISQDVTEGSGSKQFLTINDFPSWLQTDVIESRCDRHLYEYVLEGRPVRPYFDVEYDDGQLDSTETLDRVLLAIATCLAEVGIEADCASIASIFCATGACDKMPSGVKASFHIILDTGMVFRNTLEHGAFMNKILIPYIEASETLKDALYWTDKNGARRCVIDGAPYGRTQSFRLPFQSKIGSNRVFVPITKAVANYCIGLYCDVDKLEFITLPFEFGTVAVGKNHSPFEVPECSPEFDLVSALSNLLTVEFLTAYTNTLDLIFCLCGIENSDRMYDLIHTVCSRAPNYEWKWVSNTIRQFKYKGIGLKALKKWALECTDEATVKKVIKENPLKYSHELFSEIMMPVKHTQIDARYLSDSPVLHEPFGDDSDTLIIKSLLGTGKTHFIKNNVLATESYKRVLIISPRKSYTHSQKGALTEFTSYLDTCWGDLAGEDRLIIQVESLHRIGAGFQKYDLVLLDEIESILNQLHSVKTNAGNLKTNHEVLAMAVSTAGRVIMADAFISDRAFYFCKGLRNGDNTHYIENIANPYMRQAIFLSPIGDRKCAANLGGFCERIMDALRAGRRIVIVWTSKRKGDWFVKNFLETWTKEAHGCDAPSWLFYNSATSKETQEGLKSVDETWRSVQCLMMTTSITVGISYDPKIAEAEFDEAFLYGSAASAAPRDIAQALFRVRVLKVNRLTYVIDTRGSYPSGSRGFTNIWNEIKYKESKIIRNHPLIQWTTCPNWARFNFVYCENEMRNSRVEYRDILEEYLVRSGYTLSEEVHNPSGVMNKMAVDADDFGVLIWDNIEDINEDEAEKIYKNMKRGEATTEDIVEYKKWNFRRQFVGDCLEEDLRKWWGRFYESGCEGRFWNIVNEKRRAIGDMVKIEADKKYAIMVGDNIKARETLDAFLKIVGMSYSQQEVIISPEELARIGEELSKVEKQLRRGMGLRASERKGDWKVKNTIDLITVVLESWGGSRIESIVKQHRKEGKVIREYSIHINKDNNIWNNIYNYNIELDDFSIKC